jgi:hypothetical protein
MEFVVLAVIIAIVVVALSSLGNDSSTEGKLRRAEDEFIRLKRKAEDEERRRKHREADEKRRDRARKAAE